MSEAFWILVAFAFGAHMGQKYGGPMALLSKAKKALDNLKD